VSFKMSAPSIPVTWVTEAVELLMRFTAIPWQTDDNAVKFKCREPEEDLS
jgi:hypothetical protein